MLKKVKSGENKKKTFVNVGKKTLPTFAMNPTIIFAH